MRWVGIVALLFVLGAPSRADADAIDRRVEQLTTSSEYKLRLSAAVWLAKKRDPRSIKALAQALRKDSESGVRKVAAKYLGELVDEDTSDDVRKRAVDALTRAQKRDKDDEVRSFAKSSLTQISDAAAPDGNKVFVNIDKPSLGKHEVPSGMDDELRDILRDVVRQKIPDYRVEWPSGEAPTKAQLRKAKTRAFYVGTRISKLSVRRKGGTAEVECQVAIRINPWEGRDGKERWAAHQTASAKGGGKATGNGSERGVNNAKRDCVLAVAEQVMAKRIVPFMKQLAKD